MKTPAKVTKKTPPANTGKSRSGPNLTGAQYIEGVQALTNAFGAAMSHAAEKERTEQVKAQSLRDMHTSNNEVEIAHLKLAKRKEELMTERVKLDNTRQEMEFKHAQWERDSEMREKTIEIIREKMRQGAASVQDIELLQYLHSNFSDR